MAEDAREPGVILLFSSQGWKSLLKGENKVLHLDRAIAFVSNISNILRMTEIIFDWLIQILFDP